MCLYRCSCFCITPMDRKDWQKTPELTQVDLNSEFIRFFFFILFSVFRTFYDEWVVYVIIKYACGHEQTTGVIPAAPLGWKGRGGLSCAWLVPLLLFCGSCHVFCSVIRHRVSLVQWCPASLIHHFKSCLLSNSLTWGLLCCFKKDEEEWVVKLLSDLGPIREFELRWTTKAECRA